MRTLSQLVVRGRVHVEVLSVASPPAQVLQQQIRTERDGYCQYQPVSHRREHEKHAEKSHILTTSSLLHTTIPLWLLRCFTSHTSRLAYETRRKTIYVSMNNTQYGNRLAETFIAVT